jgi:hypothetical protein
MPTKPIVLFTADEIMDRGLALADMRSQGKVMRSTKVARFRSYFGSLPVVYAELWEDLQTTSVTEAQLNVKDPNNELFHFLHAIFYLRKYPTEGDSSGKFGKCDRTMRDWKWFFIAKFQALKEQKIVWPGEWAANGADIPIPIFLVSVDGIHCRCYEPQHGEWSKNPKYYSHKFKQSGLAYEVALSVFHNQVVSLNGPYPASVNDTTIFKNGLRDKIPAGRKAIVDNGYKGKNPQFSKPNPLDAKAVRQFKGRARSRQECFNTRLKTFQCLEHNFRNGEEKHKMCFEAVAVICQYQLENGSPLFDV